MEEGKKLSELRVVDLKGILEHRGLEKSGIKSVLLERLAQSVSDEGHDPETYIFKLDDADAGNKSELNDSTEESAHSANAEKTVDDSALENPESKSVVDETDVIKENSLENPPQSAGNDTSAEKPANQTLAETPNSNDVSAQGEKTEAEAEVTQDPDAEPETEKPMGAESNMEAAPVQGQESIHAEITEAKSTLENMEEKEPEVGQDGDSPITDTPGIEELSGEILGAVEAENAEESCELNLEKLPVVPEIDEAIPENDEAKPMDDSMGADPVLGFDEHEELGNIDAEDLGEADASSGFAMITDEEQLVVNVDESDTNLDYDLGEGAEEPERDAPTPTRDESVDMQSSSGTALNTVEGEEARPSPKSTDSKGDSKDLSKSQNLWVSGLSSTTRATDLKTVFSKHGKVVGAKVVTNANKPGAKCYGYVTMSSADEAAKCIQHLHRTDLHGKMISVEKAKSDPAAQARAAARAAESSNEPDKNTIIPTSKATSDSKTTDGEKREEASNRHRISLTSASARARAEREKSKQENEPGDKSRADKSRTDKPEDPLERERRRLRVQEKRLRDDDYRRRQIFLKEKRALAEQHRRLRADQLRMDRERDKLRVDREKVKIEEMKLANLERERARFEATLLDLRQRVDREREELKRVETLRLEELRRSAAVKRPYDSANSRHEEPHWEAKRPAMSDRYVGSSARQAGDSRYHGEERNTDRRTIVRKDAPVSERTGAVSRTTDDRYYAGRARTSSAAATSERRDYSSTRPSDGRHTDRRSNGSSRGGGGWPDSSRASQPSSSARFSGSRSEGRTGTEGWPASTSNTPSLLGATPDLFGSASAHAASVMMNAAAIGRSSGGGGTSQSSRYSGGGYGGGSRRY